MRSLLAALLFALTALVAACDETADLIPGGEETATPEPSAGERAAEPVFAPATLRISGNEAASPSSPAGPSDADLARAVVQVRVVDPAATGPAVRDGSGVIVDREHALVLTSAHIVVPPLDADEDGHVIEVWTNPIAGGEPRPTHAAVVAAYDPISELAVLRLTGPLGGNAPASGNDADGDDDGADGADDETPLLDAPAAAIDGEASSRRGDTLRIFGHPGLHPSGADTPQAVMVTQAALVGVRAEPAAGERAWLTTEARLPHGNAGGPVFNEAGEVVGIASQLVYSIAAPVSHARPVVLAERIIEEARAGGSESLPERPLMHLGLAPGTGLPGVSADIIVTEPRFALEALGEGPGRALLDYGRVFPASAPELHYEFAVQGAPDGARVQEYWYLDGAYQDDLSASYTWRFGQFGFVSGRLASPNPAGPPVGVWELEVRINGSVRAASRAYIGWPTPAPTVDDFAFGESMSATYGPADYPVVGSEQVLAFFAYTGASTVERLSWIVYRDGAEHYRSPEVEWRGGLRGLWWVGMRTPEGLTPGYWRFDILFDGELVGRDGFRLW